MKENRRILGRLLLIMRIRCKDIGRYQSFEIHMLISAKS